eukprot:jgi/Picre1/27549/NNA_000516.t1
MNGTVRQPTRQEQENREDKTVQIRRRMSGISWKKDIHVYVSDIVEGHRSEEDVRLVRQLVGRVEEEYTSAQTWWALLHHEECFFEDGMEKMKDIEAASDNVRKALSVVDKGIRENAQPSSHLESVGKALKDGTFVYRPFWTFSIDESVSLSVGPHNVDVEGKQHGATSTSCPRRHGITPYSGIKSACTIESKTPGFTKESQPTPSYGLVRPTSLSRSGSSRGTSDDDATISNMPSTTPGGARYGVHQNNQHNNTAGNGHAKQESTRDPWSHPTMVGW